MLPRTGEDEDSQNENGEDGEGRREGGAERDAVVGASAAGEAGDVSAEDEGVAGERLVGLIDGVASDDGGAAVDAGQRVDYGVAADDSGVARDAAGYGEIAEEDEDIAGKLPLDLDGAEEAGRAADLLAGSDEDVLAEVGSIGVAVRGGGPRWGLIPVGLREERAGEQKEGSRELEEVDGQRFAPFAPVKRRAGELRMEGSIGSVEPCPGPIRGTGSDCDERGRG